MAKKKSNIGLWIVLLGGGGLVYYAMKKKGSTTTMQPATVVSLPVTSAPALTTTPLQIPPTTTVAPSILIATAANVPTIINTTTGLPNADAAGLTTAQLNIILNWANTSLSPANLNQFNVSKGSFTPAEWAGLADLVINDWMGGQGNTPARTTFWDTWRVNYHIFDGTFK